MIRSSLVLSIALVAASALQAQSPAAVGERVRVTTATQRDAFRLVGSVSAATHDSLTVQTPNAGPQTVAVASITKLEVSEGRRGNGKRGMLYGSVIGLGAGALAGAATYKKPRCAGEAFFCPSGPGPDITAGAIVGGVVGLLAGGLWGAAHPSERWAPRALGAVGLAPSMRRLTIGLSAAF